MAWDRALLSVTYDARALEWRPKADTWKSGPQHDDGYQMKGISVEAPQSEFEW